MSQEDVRLSIESSKSTCSSASATTNSKSSLKGPTAKEIVLALTSFVRINKDEKDGTTQEFVVVKCPNGQYCKSGNGEIRYPNKSGYKNPLSHLCSCLARVSCNT